MAEHPDHLEYPLFRLEAADAADQDLRDRVHERLNARCELDHGTGCWIYTGNWDARGISKVRVGVRSYTVSRVAAWLYVAGFQLWDERWVYHGAECPHPACFNPGHLVIARNRQEAQAAMRLVGKYGSVPGRGSCRPGRRLSRQLALHVRARLAAGESAGQIAADLHVRTQSIRRIADGRSWAGE